MLLIDSTFPLRQLAPEQQSSEIIPKHTLEDEGHTNNRLTIQPSPRDRLEELGIGPKIL